VNATQQGFDIITLEKQKADLRDPEDRLAKKRILPKAQVDYNVLTNGEFPEHHWTGTQKPQPKKEYKKKVNLDVFRDYNIISNKYWEGHDRKDQTNAQANQNLLKEKYWKTHEFNSLLCSYYDPAKESEFME
jgi:hypothetical protein